MAVAKKISHPTATIRTWSWRSETFAAAHPTTVCSAALATYFTSRGSATSSPPSSAPSSTCRPTFRARRIFSSARGTRGWRNSSMPPPRPATAWPAYRHAKTIRSSRAILTRSQNIWASRRRSTGIASTSCRSTRSGSSTPMARARGHRAPMARYSAFSYAKSWPAGRTLSSATVRRPAISLT